VVQSPDLRGFLDALAACWERFRMGRVEVSSHDPLTLAIYDCFECRDLPLTGTPSCAFESGVLAALFSLQTGTSRVAKETRCYTMGDSYCQFVIDLP
jgi:transcriptional regulator, ArsR family